MSEIASNIHQVMDYIHRLEERSRLGPDSVKLVAVSKDQSIKKIVDAVHAGQTTFGENYLQEALEKIQALKVLRLEWHFIGHVQSNKTQEIAENFHWVQTIDSEKIAERLNAQRPKEMPMLHVCIQVNISGEASKSGIKPNELLPLANAIATMPRLFLRGIMVVPKKTEDHREQVEQCKFAKVLFDSLQKGGHYADTLSMGMSDDLEVSIANGSTMVRVGTAIFGSRK